jgi:hypothetical protein
VSTAGDTGLFADYPTLGVDNNALYIGSNMFDSNDNFVNTTAFVVRKSSVVSGGQIVVTAFRGLLDGTFSGPYSPQGVDNFDATATEGYFIGVDGAAFSKLQVRRVTNPGGTPSLSANIPLNVASTYYPLGVPHLGMASAANLVDGNDDRLLNAIVRNGSLWTAQGITVNSSGVGGSSGDRDGVRWYQISNLSTTPTVAQFGTIFDPSANRRFYTYGSVMVSGQGHVAFGFTSAGPNDRLNAATAGRLASDTNGTTQTPQLYTNTAASYNLAFNGNFVDRWGDYSYTSVDPNDDMTMWTIQEFANATDSYGVQVVKLIAPPPATVSTANPSSVSAGQASVNVTISGTVVNGSGFFDPGAGFPNHISASVSGGVTVNSVTYVNPTTVTLNISTVGASVGLKNVTITNPDGQSTTGTGVLTVTSTCDPLVVTAGGDDGSCGTFRGAINAANTLIGTQDVTISFNSITQVNIDSALPVLTNNGTHLLTINGTCTNQNVNGITRGLPGVNIKLNTAFNGVGLSLTNNTLINGLKITGFSSYAIDINGNGNTITCSWIGTTDGTTAAANGGGVRIAGINNNLGTAGQSQSGNLISGNAGNAILVVSGNSVATPNRGYYNWINLKSDGTPFANTNTNSALKLQPGSHFKMLRGNRIQN